MIVITWNCRGLGNPAIKRNIKDLCRLHKPGVLCLLETRSNSDATLRLPQSLSFEKNLRIPSEGYAWGLWLFWTETNFTLSVASNNE